MKKDLVPVRNPGAITLRRPLTPAQFGEVAELPPELEWLANLTNPKTRRAYKIDVEEFIAFAGLDSGTKVPCAWRTKRHFIPKRCYQFVLIILTKSLHTPMKGFGVSGLSAARKLYDQQGGVPLAR